MADARKIRRWKPSQVGIAALLALIVTAQVLQLLSQPNVTQLKADQHAQAVKTKVIERRVTRLERRRAQPPRSSRARRETPAQTRSTPVSGGSPGGTAPSGGTRPAPRPAPARIPEPAQLPAPRPAPAGGSPAPAPVPVPPPVQQVVKQTAPPVCQLRLPVVGSVCGS